MHLVTRFHENNASQRARRALAGLLVCASLAACVTAIPPPVNAVSVAGAKKIAVVNVSRNRQLMITQRDVLPPPETIAVGPLSGPAIGSGILAGAMITAAAVNIAGNTREFNERAPKGFALQLQEEMTRGLRTALSNRGGLFAFVDIDPPKPGEPDYNKRLSQAILSKCGDCDSALIVDVVFGYTLGDRILNPTADSMLTTLRLADGTITARGPMLILRDFSNNQTGHEHYHTFRDDKRDHYAPLRDMVPVIVRGMREQIER
jgi:hypothetical protein